MNYWKTAVKTKVAALPKIHIFTNKDEIAYVYI